MKLYDGREWYPVNESGDIARQATPQNFSGKWKLLAMVRFNNFGHIVESVPFPECANITDWNYKNGRGKWYPIDFDHGARRRWGNSAKIVK